MRFPSCSVLLLVIANAAMACTGTVDDGSPTSASATTAPASEPAKDPANDPGDENEGEDPFFTEGTPEGDAGPPSDSGAAPSDPTPAPPAGTPAPQLLAAEAARELKAMKVTAYDHTTFVDEASGTFKYDCSGFLGYALSKSLPTHFTAVKTYSGVSRPLAKHYQTFFAAIPEGTKKSGWSRVVRAIDLKPGDVVSWLKPADLVSTNTGHVMIVRGTPTVNPKRADEIIVPVSDSTSAFHGPTDTRYPSSDGLGVGAIGIVVDAKGEAIRYRWTADYSTKEYSTAFAFGRPE